MKRHFTDWGPGEFIFDLKVRDHVVSRSSKNIQIKQACLQGSAKNELTPQHPFPAALYAFGQREGIGFAFQGAAKERS